MKNITAFTVDREKWYRGKGETGSKLVRRDGRMCCMGFYGKTCGVPKKRMRGVGSFHTTEPIIPVPLETKYPSLLDKIYATNDCVEITERTRERLLKRYLKEANIKVTFIN